MSESVPIESPCLYLLVCRLSLYQKMKESFNPSEFV